MRRSVSSPKSITCVCRLCGGPFESDNPRAVFCPKVHYRECVVCGTSFEVKNKRRPAETCSPSCAAFRRHSSNPERLYDCTCLLCGEAFQSKQAKAKFCDRDHYKTCANCGEEYRIKDKYRPGVACSQSCASALSHTDESRVKRKKNNREKYGVDYSFQREDVKEKIAANPEHQASLIGGENFKKAMLDKYGVENYGATEEHRRFMSEHNPMRDPEVIKRLRQASREKYGTDWPIQAPEVRAKTKETMLERYGVDSPLKLEEFLLKAQETNRQRYGGPSPLSSPDVLAKIQATNLERYGVEWTLQAEEVKAKVRATNLERYGAENVFQSDEIKEKIKEVMLERYGVDNPQADPDISKKSQAKRAETMEKNPTKYQRVSKLNRAFAEELESRFGVDVTFEKAVDGSSFDLAVTGTNILIDVNPTVTHNLNIPFLCLIKSCPTPCESGHQTIFPDYHYNRALKAQANDYRLIQVFDWDDPEKIFRLIGHKVRKDVKKVSARKLDLRKIARKDANAFFDEYHIQGSVRGGKAFYGLYNDGELVAAASFGPTRFSKKYEWEWLRYAVKDGYLIHGGPGALFKRFKEDFNPNSVVSFVDFAHTTGETFLPSLGFVESSPRPSSAVWHNRLSGQTVRDNALVRLGADRLLGTNYGPREECGFGNEEIMVLEGFVKVPTAGNRVFMWVA